MLGLSKHGSNINGVIHRWWDVCENTHADTRRHTGMDRLGLCAVRAELGPLLKWTGSIGRAKEWVSVENVSLKDGDISFSALFLSGIYFTMAHSTAGDVLAYSDGASLKGSADTSVIMKHSSETNHGGQGDPRGGAGTGCGTCTEVTLWGSPDPSSQGLLSLLLLLPHKSEQIRLCWLQNVSPFFLHVFELIIWTSWIKEERTQTLQTQKWDQNHQLRMRQ